MKNQKLDRNLINEKLQQGHESKSKMELLTIFKAK